MSNILLTFGHILLTNLIIYIYPYNIGRHSPHIHLYSIDPL